MLQFEVQSDPFAAWRKQLLLWDQRPLVDRIRMMLDRDIYDARLTFLSEPYNLFPEATLIAFASEMEQGAIVFATRRNDQSWIESVSEYVRRIPANAAGSPMHWNYGQNLYARLAGYDNQRWGAELISHYYHHAAAVKELPSMDVFQGDGWRRINEIFNERWVRAIQFPHENKRS